MRTPVFNSKKNIVEHLSNPENISRYLAIQLCQLGYMEMESVKGEGPGRPNIKYVVSGKGRSLLALSKQWNKNKQAA